MPGQCFTTNFLSKQHGHLSGENALIMSINRVFSHFTLRAVCIFNLGVVNRLQYTYNLRKIS